MSNVSLGRKAGTARRPPYDLPGYIIAVGEAGFHLLGVRNNLHPWSPAENASLA